MAYNQNAAFSRSKELLELGMEILKNDGYDLNGRKEELKGYMQSSMSALYERIDIDSIVVTLQREGDKLSQVMDINSLNMYIRRRVQEEVRKSMESIAYEGVKSGFLIIFRKINMPESYIDSFLSKFEQLKKELDNRELSFKAE